MACVSLILICLVIFFLLSHAGFIFSRLSSSHFLWKMKSFPQHVHRVEGDNLQIVSTNTEQACALSQSSNQSFRGNIHPARKQTCPLILLFVLHWSCALCLWNFFCLVYFYGADMQTIQTWRSFILWSIHSLAFLWRERKAQTHIAFHEQLCQMSTQTNRWEPWCELLVDQARQTWSIWHNTLLFPSSVRNL